MLIVTKTSRWLAVGATLLLALLAVPVLRPPVAHAYYSGTITSGNPLAGYPWYVDRQRGSWWVSLRETPGEAAPLASASDNPMGKTFGSWVKNPGVDVRNYILRSQSEEPGSIPFINLARIENPSCPYPPTPAGFSEDEVKSWVRGFSAGIGQSRVMVVVETDKLTTIRCLPRWAQARRYRELRYEVHLMHTNNPNAAVYIDAGAWDWGKKAPTIARWLRHADVAEAQGFMLNASHHDWTWREVDFGLQISRMIGYKHFVVNTNTNGWGPKPHGRDQYTPFYHKGCTPPGEGLGVKPTVNTGNPAVDAFVWAGVPGYESGVCIGYGAGSPYTFYLKLAVSLTLHANPAP